MDNSPIFVKIDEYKDILGVVEEVNNKVDSIRESLDEIKEIKDKEDQQIRDWNSQLDRVTEKMDYINDTLKEM